LHNPTATTSKGEGGNLGAGDAPRLREGEKAKGGKKKEEGEGEGIKKRVRLAWNFL